MTDLTSFERRLGRRIEAHVRPAVRTFDAGSVARAVIAAGPRPGASSWSFRHRIGGGGLRMGGVVLMAGLLATSVALVLPGALGPSPSPDVRVGHLVATGPLSGTFSAMDGVELTDGRVLVVGQDRREGAGAAELWDLATGTFSVAGRALGSFPDDVALLAIPGGKAILSRVPSGFTLATGGEDVAEPALWDPATFTLTPIPLSDELRDWRPVLTLADGRVLGTARGSDPDLRSVTWDPATGIFEDQGPVDIRATYGTRLRDGRVLLAGVVDGMAAVGLVDAVGRPSRPAPPSTFAPRPDGGSRFGSPTWQKAVHLADDRVAFLGQDPGGRSDPVQVWDPATEAYVNLAFGDLQPISIIGAAGLPDSRVLIGGASYLGETTWIWDSATGTTVPGPAPDPGDAAYGWGPDAVVPLADGRVLLAAGTGSGSGRDTSFIYVP